MSRSSSNSGGSHNIFGETVGISVFRHSAHIRFLSSTFPFIPIMQSYTKSHETKSLVLIGELINLIQHLAFVLNPHFDAVWGYILGSEVSKMFYSSHLPFYDRLFVRNTSVTGAFYGLLVTYLCIALAVVATHLVIGVTAARTDRYSHTLVTFNRIALRSASSWLWIPLLQCVLAPLVCVRNNNTRLIWYYTYYGVDGADASQRELGRCEGGNHVAFIILASVTMLLGLPLYFLARWCEYCSRSDSPHIRSMRHWYVDTADFVHSAIVCVLFQTLIANGQHGAFACFLTVSSAIMVGLYVFFLPFYHHAMHRWYVCVHGLTCIASLLAAVSSMNDNWYTMMISPIILLGGFPLAVVIAFLLVDFRVNPRFLRALQLCAVDGKLASVRLVTSKSMALEDEMAETIVPLPGPHRHITHSSTTHRIRFPEGLQDETLGAFAPFDDFDDRVRVAIIGKQTYLRGMGRRTSVASRVSHHGTDDDEDEAFFSSEARRSYVWGTAADSRRYRFYSKDVQGDERKKGGHGGSGGERGGLNGRLKLYPKRFSRLLVPYISKIWCPTDVELSVSFISQCIRLLHRNPTKSMSLLAMHTFARGIVKYPHSAFLKLQFGGFIAEHLPNFSQFGMGLVNSLQLTEMAFSDAFRIIQLKQAYRQALFMRSQSDAIHSKSALAQHREVLSNMHRFWGLLMEPTVSIHLVSAEADLITRNRRIAMHHFRRAIQHLSLSNWPLIVSTGDFLSNVLLDEEGAAECYKEARELHEARMSGQMKGSRLVTFVMPDLDTLSQRLLSLLSVRRNSFSSSISSARGVVQHLLTLVSVAFVFLLAVGGVLLYIAIDERKSQLEVLEQLSSITAARSAAVRFTTIVYSVEEGSLEDRLAVIPALEELSEVFGAGLRTVASTSAFALDNSDSPLDHLYIPWSLPPIASQYLPFDASARTLTNSRDDDASSRLGGKSSKDATRSGVGGGGSSLRALMEHVQSAMTTIIFNNVTAMADGVSRMGPDGSGLLNDHVDNDMLLLTEGTSVIGVALIYTIDVLSRDQSQHLRNALILIVSVFVVGLCTLALLRVLVYVSLKRSSLERVFTFQLMTLIPYDALERLATETREKKDSIRRFQGGGGMSMSKGARSSISSPDTPPSLASRASLSGPTAPASSSSPAAAAGSPNDPLSLMLLPSVGDVFGPPSATNKPLPSGPTSAGEPKATDGGSAFGGVAGASTVTSSTSRSYLSTQSALSPSTLSVRAETSLASAAGRLRTSTLPISSPQNAAATISQFQSSVGDQSMAMLLTSPHAPPHLSSSRLPFSYATPSTAPSASLFGGSSGSVGNHKFAADTSQYFGRSRAASGLSEGGHQGRGETPMSSALDAGEGVGKVNITVLSSKAPTLVPLKSAMKSANRRIFLPPTAVGTNNVANQAYSNASHQQRRAGLAGNVVPIGGIAGTVGTGGVSAATGAANATTGALMGTVAAVKRVTFAVPQRKARALDNDTNQIWSSLSGRRIVSSIGGSAKGGAGSGSGGGGGGGAGIGMASAEDGKDDAGLGYEGVAVERSSLLTNQNADDHAPRSLFHVSRTIKRYFGSLSRVGLIFSLAVANCLFIVGTVCVGLALERLIALPALEESIRQEMDLFSVTNESWVSEDSSGARFIALGLPEDLSAFLSHAMAVTNTIPMYMNLRLNDNSFTYMNRVPASRFNRVTSGNAFTGGGTVANSQSSGSSSENYNAVGSLSNGPGRLDAVGLIAQADKAHVAQADVKKDILAVAAIGHGVGIWEFPSIESRREDPTLMLRVWERQRDIYERAQVVFMTSFVKSSRARSPEPVEAVAARFGGGSPTIPEDKLPKRRRLFDVETVTFEELLSLTRPSASPYDMPADFLLLLAGMAYADMAGFGDDSRRLLTNVLDGRMAATEDRVQHSGPRQMVVATLFCFVCGVFLLLVAGVCPVYEWTAFTVQRHHIFILCALAVVPMTLAAVTVASANIAKNFTADQQYVVGVRHDIRGIATNTLYQQLYVLSGLSQFWSLYNGCRCNLYEAVIRLILNDPDRENYVSQRGATDLFVSARVVRMLQVISNALTTTTIMNSALDGIVSTTSATTSTADVTNSSLGVVVDVTSAVERDFYDAYDAYLSSVKGLGPISSAAIRRELNRSIEDIFWNVESEVGRDYLESYFPDEVVSAHPLCYYTNLTFDLERRSPTAQRQLAIKIAFGDRTAKALLKMTDVTDGASHRASMDFRSRSESDYRYAFAVVAACLCTCILPVMGVAFIVTRLVGTAYFTMGLTARNRSNKLDSSSSRVVATRAQWSLLIIAVLLAVPFGVGVWVLVRDDAIFNEGVKLSAFEFERLQSLRAVREMTTVNNGIVMGLHSVDHSKYGVKMLGQDLGVFVITLRTSIRDFLFGTIGNGAFSGLGMFKNLDEALLGKDDTEGAHKISDALSRDTCDNVLDSSTADRVLTLSRLAAAAVEAGSVTAATTTATLASLYSKYGISVDRSVLLYAYQQWVEELTVADLTSRAMSSYADKKSALRGAVQSLEALDGVIRAGFQRADTMLRSHFDSVVDEGFTLFVVFVSVFLVAVVVVYIFVVIPLVRNLLEEAENARLLLRMIPSTVREKVPAIVQYIDTGKIDNAAELQKKFEASEKLLQNILPSNIATRLKAGEVPIADMHPSLTILFTDLVGFTKRSTTMPAAEIVDFLNEIFQQFDTIVELLELEKIKTIGDAYFMAGGLDERAADHELRVTEAGLMFLKALDEHNEMHPSRAPLQMRVGIHTGPAIAGVIGTKKVAYELWGDSVAIANAMESTGVPGFVHISQTTASKVQKYFILQQRGELPREKEHIPDDMPQTYLVVGRRVPTPYQHIIRPRLSRNELV